MVTGAVLAWKSISQGFWVGGAGPGWHWQLLFAAFSTFAVSAGLFPKNHQAEADLRQVRPELPHP